jgi:hypothetical protein
VKLTDFGGHPIPVIGKCYLRCTHKDSTRVVEFHVVETGTSLLGCADCKSMQFITFNNIEQITSETSSLSGLSSEQIFTKYAHCFEGLGRISEPYHIKVNPTVTPVVHPPRKLPASLRDRVHRELSTMEANGIIQKVDGPTA